MFDNEVRTIDALGNITERTFESQRRMLSETRFIEGEDGAFISEMPQFVYGFGEWFKTLKDRSGKRWMRERTST